jgi:hypothetical protein
VPCLLILAIRSTARRMHIHSAYSICLPCMSEETSAETQTYVFKYVHTNFPSKTRYLEPNSSQVPVQLVMGMTWSHKSRSPPGKDGRARGSSAPDEVHFLSSPCPYFCLGPVKHFHLGVWLIREAEEGP